MRRISLNIITLMVVLGATNGAFAADQDSSIPLEYQVKAAVLYKFVRYVEWPQDVLPDTLDTITIGVLGESPITDALRASVEGKEIGGYKVVIRHFGDLADLDFCHMLFIGRSEKENLKKALRRLQGWSTLTVGDAEGFAEKRGMINLVIVENKVRFEINMEAAEEAKLKISSKLLRLGKIVSATG